MLSFSSASKNNKDIVTIDRISAWLAVFRSRKMGALTLLGVASGLPYLLTRDAMQAWLTQAGIEIDTVAWLSLVSLPYSLKFLWSPLMDRFVPPFWGRRRGWIAIAQVGLVLAIAAMGRQDPKTTLSGLAIAAVVLAFFSATQDIAIDAYRTDVLAERELGAGVGVFVTGYRFALLLAGWAGLRWADRAGWPTLYGVAAVLMGLGVLVTWRSPEPLRLVQAPTSLVESVVRPFLEFFRRAGVRQGVFTLAFIVLYKLGDSLAAIVAVPFLLKTGFTPTEVGDMRNGLGLLATIVGTLAGGAVLSRIGVNRSLWVFGGLQAASNLAYFALAIAGRNYLLAIAAVNIENFCAGLGTAAFLGFLMSLCDPRFSATQFALLSSLMAISRDAIVAPAGELVQLVNWPAFFAISTVAAIPGLLLLPAFAPWNPPPQNSERGDG